MRKYTLLAFAACLLALTPLSQAAGNDTLYKSLGGKKAITAVVDDFVGRVAADDRINGFFKATASDPKRLAKFKRNLIDQICEAAGGPCKYQGKDMKTAHAGMGIGGSDFDALVEDLVASLDNSELQVEVEIRYSSQPKREIIRYAREIQPDLLVMGAHGHRRLKDLIFGNTINPVRHELRVPLLIVRK